MESNKMILEAIALRKCLDATYNRTRFTLAPHILYTRHDELHVDGVAVEKEGQAPRELKLGTFKLAGLTVHGVLDREFEPHALFEAEAEKYSGTTLFVVAS